MTLELVPIATPACAEIQQKMFTWDMMLLPVLACAGGHSIFSFSKIETLFAARSLFRFKDPLYSVYVIDSTY